MKVLILFKKLKELLDIGNHECYKENKSDDGICIGLTGGDINSNFLNYSCINCRYLSNS